MTTDHLVEHRARLSTWLADNEERLRPFRDVWGEPAEEQLAAGKAFARILYEGGWAQAGWPAEVGGDGGDALLRPATYDVIERAGYALPAQLEMLETLAPAVIKYAPQVAAATLPDALSGERAWAQGFSEPDAGSDLASLRCRAVRDGDEYVVTGQKVWTSQGIDASRIGVLVRTGTPESRHRGISMLLVDLDTPGIEVRGLTFANGHRELAEVFFDGARVPASRLVGAEGQGWEIAMYLLQFERGNYAWLRQAHIGRLIRALAARVAASDDSALDAVGDAWLDQQALRIRCGATVARLANGENPGPETSVDKILMGAAEQRASDAAASLLRDEYLFSEATEAAAWRAEWFYTRASTIYGGSAEVQRSIIADRILQLPRD